MDQKATINAVGPRKRLSLCFAAKEERAVGAHGQSPRRQPFPLFLSLQ